MSLWAITFRLESSLCLHRIDCSFSRNKTISSTDTEDLTPVQYSIYPEILYVIKWICLAEEAVRTWYNEVANYNFNLPGTYPNTGLNRLESFMFLVEDFHDAF